MPDWVLYTTIGCAALIVLLLAVLMVRGKIELGDIELGWPPKITFKSKSSGSGSSTTPTGSDTVSADGESSMGNVLIDGAAPRVDVAAKNKSTMGDVTIKRKM